MIDILTIDTAHPETSDKLQRILSRHLGLNAEIMARAEAIVREVTRLGDQAVIDYTSQFDQVTHTPETMRANPEWIAKLAAEVDDELLAAMREAISNIRYYHEKQLHRDWEVEMANGVRLGQRVRPLQIVGLYVPGGSAAYPSTVMMNAIPAQVAGVERIVVVTPPAQFSQNPVIAAVLHELGLDEVYLIGGAQAVAALACGTETIPRVDKIVGPGNQYVAAAKKLVYGAVDIDSIAGPSEIVIVADGAGNPEYIAADMLAQAEHSPGSAILLTPSTALADAVAGALVRRLGVLERHDLTRDSLERFCAIVVTAHDAEAARLADELAPEHLSIDTVDPEATLARIRHAGAAFLGPWSPVAAGDYAAGPSHVLPTGGTARFAAGLSANHFLRGGSVIRLAEADLADLAADIATLADTEGLTAHRRSVEARTGRG